MAWIEIEPSDLRCDDCRKEPATWMHPEGEATFFSCTPCLDKRTVIEIDPEIADFLNNHGQGEL